MLVKIDIKTKTILEIENENVQNDKNFIVIRDTISIADVLQGNITYSVPVLMETNRAFCFLYVPASYFGEIYFSNNKNELVISDNYYEIFSVQKDVTIDDASIASFVDVNSRTPREHTWVIEIKKCLPRMVYVINDGSLQSCRIAFPNVVLDNTKKEYEFYKNALELEVLTKVKGKVGVLLSGGVDSRLIAMILHEHHIQFNAYTVIYKPYLKDNVSDVEKVVTVCKEIGCPLKIVQCDFDKINIEELNSFIDQMPSTCHMSVGFMELLKAVGEDKVDVLFTGQNSDSLYAFGPTNRFDFSLNGFSNIFKRLCISNMYFKTLDDIKEKCVLNKIMLYIPLQIAKIIFQNKEGRKLFYPHNTKEYLRYFFAPDSVSYSVLAGQRVMIESKEVVSLKTFYQELLYEKIQNFTKGGDSESIRNATKLYADCELVLPYSGDYILKFYAQHQLKWKDVFIPKFYSYKMAKEYANKFGKKLANFNFEITDNIIKKYGKIYDLNGFNEVILSNSELGKVIQKDYKVNMEYNLTKTQVFGRFFSNYWLTRILSKLKLR